jgi:tetratricopeptide (TPR) repeat protein
LILEVSVRVIKPQPIFENHTTSDFGLPTAFRANIAVDKIFESFPYQIKTDNKRLRSFQEHSYKKPNDTYRILSIGGSIFAASGVNNNETFAYFLDQELKKRFPEKNFEVINAGKNLWELAEFDTFFLNEGYKYEPDLTIVYFHSGEISTMDFSKIEFDTIEFQKLSDHQVELKLFGLDFNQNLNTSSAMALNHIQNFPLYDKLFPTSHLLRFIEGYFRNNLIRGKTLSSKGPKKNLERSMKTWNWNMDDTIHWKTDYGKIMNSSYRQKEAVIYSIALKKFANLLNTKKSKLLFLTIPSPKEILKLENYSNDFKPFPFGDKDSITWLDLLNPFTEMQYKSLVPLNYPNVIHWTPAGHRFAAQLTFNALIKEKLFPFPDNAPALQPITTNQNLIQSVSNANKRISKQLETQGYAYFVKGVVNINLNQLDLAEKFLKISLDKSFNVKKTLWQLGRVYFFKRNFKNAAIFIQQAIDKGLRTTDTVYTLLAKSFFNSKNFPDAELNFQKAIDFFPSNYINYLNYGKMLFFQNRFSDALNAFERANTLFPKNVDTLLGIASSSLRIEKNEKAFETFKNILKIDPKNIPAQKGLDYLKTKKAR